MDQRGSDYSTRSGKITELAVAQRLLEMGLDVAAPLVDASQHDLVVYKGNRCLRVQVKGSGVRVPTGQFSFNLKRRPCDLTFDLLILHGRACDWWWIVPVDAIIGCGMRGTSINISSTGLTNPEGVGRPTIFDPTPYFEAWHLIDEMLP